MNQHDYAEAKRQLHIELGVGLRRLMKEFALENSTVEVGDIVERKDERVLVERIIPRQYTGDPWPFCAYYGPALTTGYVKYANGSMNSISQCDEMTVIKAVDL